MAWSMVARYAATGTDARQADAGRDHRHAAAVVVAVAVAGDGVGDARLLFPLRPRSHPHLAGQPAQSLLGAHRPHRRRGRRAGDAAWRRPSSMCWRSIGGAHWLAAYAVVAAMGVLAAALAVALTVALFRLIGAPAHAAGGADRGRGDRRRLRHRVADRGDPVLWQPLALRAAAIELAGRTRARSRQCAVASGARRARRSVCAGRWSRGVSLALLGATIAAFSARFGDHVIAAAGVVAGRWCASAAGRKRSAAARRRACCGARNGRCSSAIPG